MTASPTPSQQIIDEVTSWPGIEARMGDRGELAFKLGLRQIGHLHADRAAHFSFPKDVWTELLEEGRITPHPVFPDRRGPSITICVRPPSVRSGTLSDEYAR